MSSLALTCNCQGVTDTVFVKGEIWKRGKDLNLRPLDYESSKLPTALPRCKITKGERSPYLRKESRPNASVKMAKRPQ